MTSIAPTPTTTPAVDDSPQSPTTAAPVRTRRSKAWLAAAIAAILLGGVAGGFVMNAVSQSTQVLVASGDIARGETITREDLSTIAITDGQTTTAVAIDRAQDIIGSVAAVDIPAGSLITDGSITQGLEVPPGQAVVGLNLTGAQLPAQQLRAGDSITLVPIAAQGVASTDPTQEPEITQATVSRVTLAPDGVTTIVDVYVAGKHAARVTALAATGNIAVFLSATSEAADE